MQNVLEPVRNPETNEVEVDDDNNIIYAPVPEQGTDLSFEDIDVTIESVVYNDEDERTQLMLEQVMSGNIGQMLSAVNPVGFFRVSSLMLRRFGTKYSAEVAQILAETAQMLGGNPQMMAAAQQFTQGGYSDQRGSNSQMLKLPTNTNEAPV